MKIVPVHEITVVWGLKLFFIFILQQKSFINLNFFSDYKSWGKITDYANDKRSTKSNSSDFKWPRCHGQVTNRIWLVKQRLTLHVQNERELHRFRIRMPILFIFHIRSQKILSICISQFLCVHLHLSLSLLLFIPPANEVQRGI